MFLEVMVIMGFRPRGRQEGRGEQSRGCKKWAISHTGGQCKQYNLLWECN